MLELRYAKLRSNWDQLGNLELVAKILGLFSEKPQLTSSAVTCDELGNVLADIIVYYLYCQNSAVIFLLLGVILNITALNSGHLRLCQQPRAEHALRSDQNPKYWSIPAYKCGAAQDDILADTTPELWINSFNRHLTVSILILEFREGWVAQIHMS
jgi:hypothetical protein